MLRTIMDFVFAPAITVEASYTVDGLVEEHHAMFLEVLIG